MLEPISFIAMICGAVGVTVQLFQAYQMRKAKKLIEGDKVEVDLLEGFRTIWLKYNGVAAITGRSFVSRFIYYNDKIVEYMKQLGQILLGLQDGLKRLQIIKASLQNSHDSEHHDELYISMLGDVRKFQKVVVDVLSDLSQGLPILDQGTALKPKRPPRPFCEGAKLCQSGNRNSDYISKLVEASPSQSSWGYVCSYCLLEVGYYPAVRISHNKKTFDDDSSLLLTASHLVAWKSLENRRAFYRCLECYKQRQEVDFSSAAAFENHMGLKHPGFNLIEELDEDKKIRLVTAKLREIMGSSFTQEGSEKMEVADSGLEPDQELAPVDSRSRNPTSSKKTPNVFNKKDYDSEISDEDYTDFTTEVNDPLENHEPESSVLYREFRSRKAELSVEVEDRPQASSLTPLKDQIISGAFPHSSSNSLSASITESDGERIYEKGDDQNFNNVAELDIEATPTGNSASADQSPQYPQQGVFYGLPPQDQNNVVTSVTVASTSPKDIHVRQGQSATVSPTSNLQMLAKESPVRSRQGTEPKADDEVETVQRVPQTDIINALQGDHWEMDSNRYYWVLEDKTCSVKQENAPLETWIHSSTGFPGVHGAEGKSFVKVKSDRTFEFQ